MFRYLLLVFLLLTPLASADELDSFIEAHLKRYQVPGCAVGIVYQGKVVKLQGYGVRKKGESAAVDPDTIFQLASLTKAMTASLLGHLVSQGKLEWDKPVINYMPELQLENAFATQQLSLRDLLAHRSGWQAFQGSMLGALPLTRAQVIERVRYMPLLNGFREKAGYNNVGIFLAGMVGEKAGGDTYENLMQKRLFTPLGMKRSSFLHGPHSSQENISAAHFGDGRSIDVFEDHSVLAPAGACTSTARDLCQWLLMLLNQGGSVMKPSEVEEMFRPAMVETPGIAETPPIDDNSGFSYGLTWGIFSYNGYKVAEKGGALAGTRTVAVVVPEKQLGVVVLCNLNGTLLPELIRARVLQDYLGTSRHDLKKEIWQTQLKVNEFFAATTHRPKADPNIKAQFPLATYAGTYQQPLYGPLQILSNGKELTWRFSAENQGPLIPAGYNSFWLSYSADTNRIPEIVHFLLDEKGQVQELVTESYGRFEHQK